MSQARKRKRPRAPNRLWSLVAAIVIALAGMEILARVTARLRIALWPSATAQNIVFLGDEDTAGAGVDPGTSYPDQFLRKFHAVDPLHVVNLATAGANSSKSVAELENYLRQHGRPRAAFVLVGRHDGDNFAGVDPLFLRPANASLARWFLSNWRLARAMRGAWRYAFENTDCEEAMRLTSIGRWWELNQFLNAKGGEMACGDLFRAGEELETEDFVAARDSFRRFSMKNASRRDGYGPSIDHAVIDAELSRLAENSSEVSTQSVVAWPPASTEGGSKDERLAENIGRGWDELARGRPEEGRRFFRPIFRDERLPWTERGWGYEGMGWAFLQEGNSAKAESFFKVVIQAAFGPGPEREYFFSWIGASLAASGLGRFDLARRRLDGIRTLASSKASRRSWFKIAEQAARGKPTAKRSAWGVPPVSYVAERLPLLVSRRAAVQTEDVLRFNFRRLGELSMEGGFPLYVLSYVQPGNADIDRRIRHAASQEGLRLIDAGVELRPRWDEREFVEEDGYLLNENGNKLLADLIARSVENDR